MQAATGTGTAHAETIKVSLSENQVSLEKTGRQRKSKPKKPLDHFGIVLHSGKYRQFKKS